MNLLNEGRNLDWPSIHAMLVEQARTVVGRELLKDAKPSAYRSIVEEMLEKTSQAETILYNRGENPMQPFEDVRGHVARARAGGILSMKELLDIAQCLRCALQVSRGVGENSELAPDLCAIATLIDPQRRLEQEIERCIISAEEMSDSASATLSSIRRRIKSLNGEIQQRLSSMIHSPSMQKYLQEAIITRRNGRYVLPVRQEYRAQVNGLVHDQSASGATLYIEPMAIVNINNDLRTLASEESLEIERILSVLTAQVEGASREILQNQQAMGELDAIFARAELARNMKAVRPKLSNDGKIVIRQGRHPLIDAKAVVPLDLWVGDEFTQLLITGPNTGGKTVSLKTVGLFAVMTQTGLFLPANEGTTMPIFEHIYADIGDEQSIEQSLSTFSAHMTNIVRILEDVDDKSLVLLDELGAGTDPTEGAALAISILEEVRSRGALSVATTHYSELKAYGMTTEGVANASVEFDVETLAPTYRLSIGVPGRSNAFEISKRLGLDTYIIDRARNYVSGESVRFEEVIASAQEKQRQAEEQIENTRQALLEAQQARREAIRSRDAWINQRDMMLERARAQAAESIAEAKREGQRIIDEMNKMLRQGNGQIKPHQMHALQKQFDAKLDAVAPAPSIEGGTTAEGKAETLTIGMTVMYKKLNQKATVLRLADDSGKVQIQIGSMKLMADADDLYLTKGTASTPAAQSQKKEFTAVGRDLPLQCDLRGLTIEEARIEVDRYLDDAMLAGLTKVTIVHGKGTGALRTGVRAYLKTHPLVKSMREGKFSEGEDGVSIVELR